MADSDEEYYEVPLRDQKYFGAGIKRKRVNFVPSSTSNDSAGHGAKPSSVSASERYLAVVFGKSPKSASSTSTEDVAAVTKVAIEHDKQSQRLLQQPHSRNEQQTQKEVIRTDSDQEICDICKTPLDPTSPSASSNTNSKTNTHMTSLVHQICLPHAHPPSALDHKRKGISILQSHGWDPDARLGLGVQGEGILHPVKAKEKRDTVGLGAGKDYEEGAGIKKPKKKIVKEVIRNLDAGKIQKMDVEQRRKDKRLREMFYSNDEVDKYLGGGGAEGF